MFTNILREGTGKLIEADQIIAIFELKQRFRVELYDDIDQRYDQANTIQYGPL